MKTTDANQWLRNDHKTITGLITQYQALDRRNPSNQQMIRGVVQETLMEIQIHSELEESIFYPAFKASAREEGEQALIEESILEHQAVDAQIAELKSLDLAAPEFHEKLDELFETFQAHLAKEENELLPKAAELLAAKLEGLGGELQRGKTKLLAEPRFADALPQRVQNQNGGEQKRKGRAA